MLNNLSRLNHERTVSSPLGERLPHPDELRQVQAKQPRPVWRDGQLIKHLVLDPVTGRMSYLPPPPATVDVAQAVAAAPAVAATLKVECRPDGTLVAAGLVVAPAPACSYTESAFAGWMEGMPPAPGVYHASVRSRPQGTLLRLWDGKHWSSCFAADWTGPLVQARLREVAASKVRFRLAPLVLPEWLRDLAQAHLEQCK